VESRQGLNSPGIYFIPPFVSPVQLPANCAFAPPLTQIEKHPRGFSFSPDIPTVGGTLKGFEVQAWFGWIAPIGVPKVIIDQLTAELNAVGQELVPAS
jgi:Tripartite tricarboxylate transporter family receptor